MTLIIATTNPSGVVLTADSRQTYTNRAGMPRIASDNATKILELTKSSAIAVSGTAFIQDAGRLRPIQSYLEEFRESRMNGIVTVAESVAAFKTFLEEVILRVAPADIQAKVAKDGCTDLSIGPPGIGKLTYTFIDASGQVQSADWPLSWVWFIIVGRDPDGVCHSMTGAPFQPPSIHATSDTPQLHWVGQTEVLGKLFTGQAPFVVNAATMTIQDAIDFSVLLTRTTEKLHKFCDGLAGTTGGVPGVGGPIDVVFVPVSSGDLQFLSRKVLTVTDPRV